MRLLNSAYANLRNNRKKINSMNVFPVPDGDTGDNMCCTLKSGIDAVEGKEYGDLKSFLSDFSSASLMGARGNSGVILSLIFKGFSGEAENEMTGKSYCAAMKGSVRLCYDSVQKPREGTILTVLRVASEKAAKASRSTSDFGKVFIESYTGAVAALSKTRELLPELKKANTADAGAKGLVCIMEGIRSVLQDGREYEYTGEGADVPFVLTQVKKDESGYCCEGFLKGAKQEALKKRLSPLGDSLLTAEEGDGVKFHLHSLSPHLVIKELMRSGEIEKIKIENMSGQNRELYRRERKKYAFLCVSSGEGVTKCLYESGADCVLEDTGKISAGQVLRETEKLYGDNIFLFPNDENNYMAFSQAAKLSKENCTVINTPDFPSCLCALMSFDESLSPDENRRNMQKAANNAKRGKIYAPVNDENPLKKSDSIGIIDGEIRVRGRDSLHCMEKVVEKLCDKGYNDISVFCGDGVTQGTAEYAQRLLSEKYSSVNVIHGKQNIYDYVVMVN